MNSMKKILFLLTGLILLGAGCVNKDEVNQLIKQNQDLQLQLAKQQQASEEKNEFDLQSKCAGEGKKFYNQYKKDSESETAGYISHWNKTLKKCFVSLSSMFWVNGQEDSSKVVYDALEGKLYGSFMVVRDVPLASQKPFDCEMNSDGTDQSYKPCYSEAEFNSYENSLMNN